MDARTLQESMLDLLPLDRAQQLLPGFMQACRLAHLNTATRRAMFLAMVGEESGSLRWTEELADGSEYNWRSDLGNTVPGDGPRYKGRTFIQITGRHNYTQLSLWAFAHDIVPTPSYFVDHPERLSQDKYVWLGPVWYWTVARPGLNAMADRHDVVGATQAINGGMNGYDDRLNRWNVCMRLGPKLLGGTFKMDDDKFKKLVLDALESAEGQRLVRNAMRETLRGFLSWDGEHGHRLPTLLLRALDAVGLPQQKDLPGYPRPPHPAPAPAPKKHP